jgi:hypothetical protein
MEPHQEPYAARRLEGWPHTLPLLNVLRDARKGALLRMMSFDDIVVIGTSEGLYQVSARQSMSVVGTDIGCTPITSAEDA